MIDHQQKFSMQKFTTYYHFQLKTGFILGHPQNFIRKNFRLYGIWTSTKLRISIESVQLYLKPVLSQFK